MAGKLSDHPQKLCPRIVSVVNILRATLDSHRQETQLRSHHYGLSSGMDASRGERAADEGLVNRELPLRDRPHAPTPKSAQLSARTTVRSLQMIFPSAVQHLLRLTP